MPLSRRTVGILVLALGAVIFLTALGGMLGVSGMLNIVGLVLGALFLVAGFFAARG
jgi:hypothetical protein